MKRYYPAMPLGAICRLFGKTRQAYYKAAQQQEQENLESAVIVKLVSELRKDLPKVGTRKLYHMMDETLSEHKIRIGRDKFFDLLSDHRLLVRRKRRKAKTTNSRHWLKKYPNLIGKLDVSRANEVWVSDITYISTGEGFSYLSLITDVYSRKIVGYCLSRNLKTEGCLQALRMALEHYQGKQRLIHHSDRGLQYCSARYVKMLKSRQILISMTQKGDPAENAIAERVNGILKTEFDLGGTFASHEEATEAVERSITRYNQMRPHSSCNYLTPDAAYRATGHLQKRWKTYRRKKPGITQGDGQDYQ